jgi:hypothetical protein
MDGVLALHRDVLVEDGEDCARHAGRTRHEQEEPELLREPDRPHQPAEARVLPDAEEPRH